MFCYLDTHYNAVFTKFLQHSFIILHSYEIYILKMVNIFILKDTFVLMNTHLKELFDICNMFEGHLSLFDGHLSFFIE